MKIRIGLFFVLVTTLHLTAEPLAKTLEGKLVAYRDGAVTPVENALEGKKLIAMYYSAHWCGPCRAFTPELVKFYNETSEKHPELEIIFVSSDRSAEAMAEYMAWGNMPFLAVNFDDRQMEALRKHAARGIPYLIVMDDQGNVVIEKPAGESWMYPGEALKQLKAKLGS